MHDKMSLRIVALAELTVLVYSSDGVNTSRQEPIHLLYFKEDFLSFLVEASWSEVTGPQLLLQPNG